MRRSELVWGVLVLAAAVIYMLACGSQPAWSPDSKRVVFGFTDRDAGTHGLALYDLTTKKVERIYEAEGEGSVQPVWPAEGEAIVALAARQGEAVEVVHLDLKTTESRLLASLPAKEAATAMMIPPVLAGGRYLLFSSTPDEEDAEVEVYCFDLQTNKLSVLPGGQGRYLFKAGKDFLYLSEAEEALELGSLDTKRLKFRRLALFNQRTHGAVALGLAGTANGRELAVVAGGAREDQAEPDAGQEEAEVLIINRQGKILKRIPLPAVKNVVGPISLAYGPGEKTLWVAMLQKSDSEQLSCSLLEVDLKTGAWKKVVSELLDKDDYVFLQPSISPDGKWLAVDMLLSKDGPSSVLYLVDLTDPQRKVTKVTVPVREGPGIEEAGE